MSIFSNNDITDVGRVLLADVHAGAVFTPTRIVLGSGNMPIGSTVKEMTGVINPVVSLSINKKIRTSDGKCIFGGIYSNKEITEPFYFRELALYAKAIYYNIDGSVRSEGKETLYSYGNAGSTADLMPAYSTSTVVEKQMDLVTWIGNDVQVNLTIESGLFLTREYFEAHIRLKQNKLAWVTDEDIDAMFAGTYEGVEDEDPEGNGYVGDFGIDDNDVDVDTTWSSQKISEEIAKMATYEAIEFTSLTAKPSATEIGNTDGTIVIEWVLNAQPTTLTIDNVEIENPAQSGNHSLPLGAGQEDAFTIAVTASDGLTSICKNVSVPFYNGVYYGATGAPEITDSAFILGLTKQLRGSKLPSFTVTAAEEQYIYYCVPVRFGTCKFAVGGFTGGFVLAATVPFTNASGYTEDYYVYQSVEHGLGTQTVNVS